MMTRISINRRRGLWIGASVALVSIGGPVTWIWGAFSASDGKVTLKSRVLKYNYSLMFMKNRPSQEESDAYVTALMGEYFYMGMHYDEVVRVLHENDLVVDEKFENKRDFRFENSPVYFNRSIVSVVNLPSKGFLVTLTYRLILRFKADQLDEFKAVFVGSGL